MSVGARKSVGRRWAWRIAASFALATVTLGISGCNTFNWRGDNFHDDMAHWGEKQRPPDQAEGNSEMLGLSAKSQQIEKNLGVR
jgi:hypothetical protein